MPVSLGIVQPNFYGIFEAPDVWETTVGFVLDWGMNELLPRMKSLTHTRYDDVLEADFIPGEHGASFARSYWTARKCKGVRRLCQADEEFIAMLSDQDLDRFYGCGSKRAGS
jgi:hypothetical protein